MRVPFPFHNPEDIKLFQNDLPLIWIISVSEGGAICMKFPQEGQHNSSETIFCTSSLLKLDYYE
jgi:hypothetical protein